MDLTSIIAIIIGIAVIYLFIRFIVSPVIRVIIGIIIFLTIIYFLQRFFGFDANKVLEPFGINLSKWGININWILEPINYYVNLIWNFLSKAWQNIPKK